jgi:hypothetical protein
MEKKNPPGKSKKKITIKQLRDKHMKDKNHVITDDEINALDLETNAPDRSSSHTPEIENTEDRPKDEDKDKKMVTPWDVLDQ